MIRVHRAKLIQIVERAALAVPSRTPREVLYCVLLEFKKKRVTATCSNDSLRIVSWFDFPDTNGETFLVPADRLLKLLRSLNDEEVILVEESNFLQVRAKSGRWNLPATDYATYPPDQELKLEPVTIVKSRTLADAINKVSFAQQAASESHMAYNINSTLLHIQGEKMVAVATDTRTLAICESSCDLVKEGDEYRLMLPPSSSAAVSKIMGGVDVDVEIQTTKDVIRFLTSDVSITTSLVSGVFPKYERILTAHPESSYDAVGTLVPNTIKESVDRTIMVANTQLTSVAIFRFADNTLKISKRSDSGVSDEEVMVSMTGKPAEVRLSTNMVSMALSRYRPGIPINFRASDGERDPLFLQDQTLTVFIMPCMLGSENPPTPEVDEKGKKTKASA
jgi:DNA polymerase III sliding clamp (beta) subunit (PCNA family)